MSILNCRVNSRQFFYIDKATDICYYKNKDNEIGVLKI